MFDREKKLIRKIKNGDQEAFEKLYNTYADYSLRTAYGITKNQSDASDIVQETFIKVYRNLDKYDMKKPFKPWFYQILINEAKRYIAKKSKQAISMETEQLLDYFNSKKTDSDSEVWIEDLEVAMEELDDNHRTVLILKYLNEFKEKEIAEILELNVNTVKSRLYKARQRLKEIVWGVAGE
ncbi:RNA polymerase sigma factor [Virgibacillus halodenitrificans]|uniref:RNA polymerase sigma factor n=1 Tax=Virgibacillus halodenitrificans TaxID=1482 RepID=UPI002DBDE767|nr:RNA polymerase sigma factor [Virgibacillus halodenitrificans]MEC2157873.1 RNA polymerase sigma factor [Virgibacillus halodenitrificans]